MATKYVTLKDPNGDTLYPQAVATNLVDGSISQDKIDWDNVNKALLTYQPTQIPNNSDLNTPAFLKLGTYYVGTNNSAATISNSPVSIAFKMEVTSHGPSIDDETTNPWMRRFRIITDIDGRQWMQVAYAWGTAGSITYGPWNTVSRTYIKGTSVSYSGEGVLLPGRQRSVSGNKYIYTTVPLDGCMASDVTSVTFTPSAYNEAFGDQGTIFSVNNPTTSQLVFSCSPIAAPQRNLIRIAITLNNSYSIQSNHACVVKLSGSFTFN